MKGKIKKIAGWGLGVALLLAAILLLTAASYVSSLDVSKLGEPLAEPTIILDRNGEEIYKLSVQKFEPVSITEMPQVLLDAIIAVEDRRFYEHPGVDLPSIARALVVDLKAGEFVEGASTITQQLARNAFLSFDKTIERKLKEAAYALKIDMTYNKDEVLELYLNTIYFGSGAYGVQAASQTYFGKDVSDLTLEEAALIAGLPKAPSRYSPFNNPDLAVERRNVVLRLMAEQGLIDKAELQAALEKELMLNDPSEEEASQAQYASYIDVVIQEAEDRYGISERELMGGGFVILTEMDRRMQEAAAAVFADPSQFPASADDQMVQSGAVFLDQTTGGIRALMGYRGEGTYRAFNRAVQLKRQPGSSFKPIAVFAPALEAGYTPMSKLYDGPLDINGYQPRNWDRDYRGEVVLAEAVRQSWNIPAVWLLHQIGVDRGYAFAQRLGVELAEEDRNLSLALGGLTEGVSPLMMAQAFSAFANNGVLHEAHTISEIRSRDGALIARYEAQPRQVMDPNAAFTMTLLLQFAVEEGTGRSGAVPGWPTAGKTGSTQLPDTEEFAGIAGGSKDLWFTGYTPALTGSVWIGYDHTDREHYMTVSSGAAASVFREIMTRALADEEPRDFAIPPGFRADWADEDEDEDREDEKEEKKKKNKRKKKEKEKKKKDRSQRDDDDDRRKKRERGKKDD